MTMKILIAKLRREVNLRATRDLGSEMGNKRPKQKNDAQTISPVDLPVVSFYPSQSGSESAPKLSIVYGISVLNSAI